MLVETQELITKVDALTTASDAIQALVDNLTTMIASANDLAALKTAAADISRETDEIVAATLRNTPQPPV